MSAGTYQETSWSWQLQQLLQQANEWLEARSSDFNPELDPPDLPDWSIPEVVLRAVFWGICLILVTLLVLRLWDLLKPQFRQWRSRHRHPGQQRSGRSSQHLPVSGWIQQADRCYRQGQYSEACRALYMALLQRLHDRKILLQDPARTDQEYRRSLQVSSVRQTPQAYQVLLTTHERLCFSSETLTETDFRNCQRAYRETDAP